MVLPLSICRLLFPSVCVSACGAEAQQTPAQELLWGAAVPPRAGLRSSQPLPAALSIVTDAFSPRLQLPTPFLMLPAFKILLTSVSSSSYFLPFFGQFGCHLPPGEFGSFSQAASWCFYEVLAFGLSDQLLWKCKNANHRESPKLGLRILEWFRLVGTLLPLPFYPLAMVRNTFH